MNKLSIVFCLVMLGFSVSGKAEEFPRIDGVLVLAESGGEVKALVKANKWYDIYHLDFLSVETDKDIEKATGGKIHVSSSGDMSHFASTQDVEQAIRRVRASYYCKTQNKKLSSFDTTNLETSVGVAAANLYRAKHDIIQQTDDQKCEPDATFVSFKGGGVRDVEIGPWHCPVVFSRIDCQ